MQASTETIGKMQNKNLAAAQTKQGFHMVLK